jgi:hypothetical protein
MTGRFEHPSYLGWLSRAASIPAQPSAIAEPAARYRRDRCDCQRACCCSAEPAVIVMLPPTDRRPHATDLLFCGHHFRQSRAGLLAQGATFLDLDGYPLAAEGWLPPTAAR